MSIGPLPAEMSDEELTRQCKRNRLEEWLHQSGCLVGLLLGLAGCILLNALTFAGVIRWGWCLTAYLSVASIPFVGISTYSFFEYLSEFRCRHFLQELRRRHGCLPLEWYIKEAISETAPGQVVVLFSGCTLPVSSLWWVRLTLPQHGSTGTIETRHGVGMFDFGEGRLPDTAFARAQATLDHEQAARILALTEKAQEAGSLKLASTVKDGFPVSCAVIVGGAKKATTMSCNLAGVPARKRDNPQVKLIEEVFAAGRALIEAPSFYGSCDMYGNIEIKDV